MQVTKNYAPTPWSNDGSTLSDKYGNDLFVAEDGEDVATLALFDAAPDLVEALIEMCKMAHAFNDQTGTVDNTWEESQQQAEECWDEMLDGSSKASIKTRAALIKAGVITK